MMSRFVPNGLTKKAVFSCSYRNGHTFTIKLQEKNSTFQKKIIPAEKKREDFQIGIFFSSVIIDKARGFARGDKLAHLVGQLHRHTFLRLHRARTQMRCANQLRILQQLFLLLRRRLLREHVQRRSTNDTLLENDECQ